MQHLSTKLNPGLPQNAWDTHRSSGRTEPCWRCSELCVKAAAHRTGSELIIIKPHPSFPYLAWVGWTAANHPPKGSKSRKSIILPPSQLHWHAQSAHGHQHQPPFAYFTDPAPSEGSHSLLVDESAKGSSESQRKINMSRRKQAKPQHLKSDEEATQTGLLCKHGRCPGSFLRLLLGLLQLLFTDHPEKHEQLSFKSSFIQGFYRKEHVVV